MHVSNTDRLRGVSPPRLPDGRGRRAARAWPARRAPGRGRRRHGQRAQAGDRRDPDLALGRAGDDRHVGPEARAPEEIRGEFRPIATAAPGVSISEHMPGLAKVDGPLRAGPFARPHDHGARAGHDLHGHGQPAERRAGVPVAGVAGGAGLAAAEGRPALRHVRRAARRRGRTRARLPRPGVRPVRGRGRARLEERSRRSGVSLPSGFTPGDLAIARGAAAPVRPRPAGARVDRGAGGPRPLPSPGAGDPPLRPRPRPRSTSRASRRCCATTTAGRRWARGRWPPGG